MNHTSELYKAGIISFVIGLFVFFGHSHIVGFFLTITYSFVSPSQTAFEIISNLWLGLSAFGMILIISGVVMFYLGKREGQLKTDREDHTPK